MLKPSRTSGRLLSFLNLCCGESTVGPMPDDVHDEGAVAMHPKRMCERGAADVVECLPGLLPDLCVRLRRPREESVEELLERLVCIDPADFSLVACLCRLMGLKKRDRDAAYDIAQNSGDGEVAAALDFQA